MSKPMEQERTPLLEIHDLKTCFHTPRGTLWAVRGIDLVVYAGTTLALVGESGCGKTTAALSILRLIPSPPGKIASGQILFKGADVLNMTIKELRKIRGNRISMIFQEAMSALNPVFTIGDQIAEVIRVHQKVSPRQARERAISMLQKVGIPSPEQRFREYPWSLSGGMRQRAMIAMALSCSPDLLIADEPSTALDVTIQAQVLELMASLKAETGMAMLLITHNLGVVAQTADVVAVMYAGRIVEYASVYSLFDHPMHPYTIGLLGSLPKRAAHRMRRARLEVIPGMVPELTSLPEGCSFQDRCPYAIDQCRHEEPPMTYGIDPNDPSRGSACWRAKEL